MVIDKTLLHKRIVKRKIRINLKTHKNVFRLFGPFTKNPHDKNFKYQSRNKSNKKQVNRFSTHSAKNCAVVGAGEVAVVVVVVAWVARA